MTFERAADARLKVMMMVFFDHDGIVQA